MDDKRWDEKGIQDELRLYRQMKCQAEQLRLDIATWDDILETMRNEAIEGAVLGSSPESDMPKGNATSDPTGRIGTRLPDEIDRTRAKVELRDLVRRVARVDAWLGALSNRERTIVRMLYIDGMVWGEVVYHYNQRPTDGFARAERTLMQWKQEAVRRLLKIANYEICSDPAAISQ